MYSAKVDDRSMYPFGKAVIPEDIKNLSTEHPKDMCRETTINKINSRWAQERIPEEDERKTNKNRENKEDEVNIETFFPLSKLNKERLTLRFTLDKEGCMGFGETLSYAPFKFWNPMDGRNWFEINMSKEDPPSHAPSGCPNIFLPPVELETPTQCPYVPALPIAAFDPDIFRVKGRCIMPKSPRYGNDDDKRLTLHPRVFTPDGDRVKTDPVEDPTKRRDQLSNFREGVKNLATRHVTYNASDPEGVFDYFQMVQGTLGAFIPTDLKEEDKINIALSGLTGKAKDMAHALKATTVHPYRSFRSFEEDFIDKVFGEQTHIEAGVRMWSTRQRENETMSEWETRVERVVDYRTRRLLMGCRKQHIEIIKDFGELDRNIQRTKEKNWMKS